MTERQLPATPPLERAEVDWERHKGNGNPKIKPPPGVVWRSNAGRKQPHRYYTRVTTYADALSDQWQLMGWKMRRVALGMGQRSDYVRLASALTDRPDDRDALDELAAKALEAAGPNKADEGTALHALTERIDRGEPLGTPPEELLPDLAAYEALAGKLYGYMHREVRVVNDELETAGTPDGVGFILEPCPAGCGPDVLHVIDTKTGSIAYPGKMAVQLAIYSRSSLYDPATGERHPLGELGKVCLKWGAITHLPVETGRAAPYWLDLEYGWAGALLCGPVREWRKGKADDILRPFETIKPVHAAPGGVLDEGPVRLASTSRAAPAAVTEVPAVVELDPAAWVAEVARAEANEVAPEADDVPLPDLCAHSGGYRGGRCRDCGEPADDVYAAILGCVTDRDLEVLWQRDRARWRRGHLKVAADRMGELKARRDAERPQAAAMAAITTCPDPTQLTTLVMTHRDEPWWSPELAAAADERWRALFAERGRTVTFDRVIDLTGASS